MNTKGLLVLLTREQAIFFETIEDLAFEGRTELLILAYHEFLSEYDFAKTSDVQVHLRAKELIQKYQQLWYTDVNLDELRWEVLEQLDLEDAAWEYLDQNGTEAFLQEEKPKGA